MKTLIIYYSDSGSTKIMARTLSMNLKADIIGIKDLKNRKGFTNRLLSSVDAFRESKTDISPAKVDLTDYDLIYIGTPTWAGKPTPAIITLIDRCNWAGKDVILFTTMTKDGSEESTLERLDEKVSIRGARVVESFSLNTKEKSPEDIINDTEGIIQTLVLKMYSGAWNMKTELKIKAIENGTVIDHITANKALHILKILGLPDEDVINVTVAMNVFSRETGQKDIVKIENREIDHEELNQIALIAPKATINIIRDYEVVKKDKIILPNEITSIIKCTNNKCITNYENEPITSKFKVIETQPPVLRCHYCEKILKNEDIEKQFE